MRKLLYQTNVSLDGFIEDAAHNLDWSIVDEEYHRHINDQVRTAGAFLFGRRTYDVMVPYWPNAVNDPTITDFELDFANIFNSTPKIVFSRTLEHLEGARLVREDAVEEVRRLMEQPGGNLHLGGANLAATFLRLGMVEEIQLYIHPVILGGGTPAFPPLERAMTLKTLESHTFKSGVVFVRYQAGSGG